MFDQLELNNFESQILLAVTEYGVRVLVALIILFLGWIVSKWVSRRILSFSATQPRLDPTLVPVFAKAGRLLIIALTLLMALNSTGIPITSFLAVMGAAGLAIGLALQGTLSNVAAGLILLSLRPFEVGDLVEVGGNTATVDEIGLIMTRMRTPDNVYLGLPNSQIWGKEIRNFSRNPTRRIDLVIGISYDDDIDRAIELVQETLKEEPRILPEPAPVVAVGELADSSVNLFVRPWVNRADFMAVKMELQRTIKQKFDRQGVTIPFPQRDVHLHQVAEAG